MLGPSSGVGRRVVLRGLAGGLAGLACGGRAYLGFAAEALRSTSLQSGIHLLEGAGGNVLVVATDAGKVVVDTGVAAASAAVMEALQSLAGGAVKAVFNTHWHLDQVGSNTALGAAGAMIYAHAKTRQRLSNGYYLPTDDRYEPPLPPAGRPTQSFHAEGSTTIDGRRVEYGYLFEAHTDGDIFVFFPHANLVAVGDVVTSGRDPVFDWFGGGWLGGRLDALQRLLQLGDRDTRFVPSYGPPVGRAHVQSELELLTKIFDRLVEHVRLGETAEDMYKLGVLDGLGRTFADPAKLLYDLHKGFWAHHNTLSHDIV